MKKDAGKRELKKKERKSSVRALARTALLAGGLLVPTPSAARPLDEVHSEDKSIEQRVKIVGEALKKKLSVEENYDEKLSYSEVELAQWGNWGNWGNWNNWNNWRNWGNWGNWRNY
ncbi:MAG: hypothetical protein M3416_02235 [Acidobacteriota bacterium]|nr:hypothetical protein [Acidobacteriota bacterium]